MLWGIKLRSRKKNVVTLDIDQQDIQTVETLLHEIETEAASGVQAGNTPYRALKNTLQRILRLADTACENIANDPENHILRPPAADGAHIHQQQKEQPLHQA